MRHVKRMLEIGGFVCWVSISSLLLLEAVLRIHNPLHTSVRGNQIVLTANMSWTYSGGASSQLDERILHRKNNIGFRGEDYDSGTDALRVFTIGGSTTEDVYLTEGKTWSDHLRQLLAPSFPRSLAQQRWLYRPFHVCPSDSLAGPHRQIPAGCAALPGGHQRRRPKRAGATASQILGAQDLRFRNA